MRLRTLLILSYLAIILGGGISMYLLTDMAVDHIEDENLSAALRCIDDTAKGLYQLSEKIFITAGESIVAMMAKGVSTELSYALAGKAPYNYDALRKDENLRKIALQDIYSWGGKEWDKKAGSVDVYDKTGEVVFHSNRTLEGKNYHTWKDEYPRMWRLTERSFTEPKVQGYYTFIDENQRERRKFDTSLHVPGTPFVVDAVVNIDEYFEPVHLEIKKRVKEARERVDKSIRNSGDLYTERIRWYAFIGGSVVMVLAMIFSLWLASYVSRPIRRLCDGVDRMGEGDFEARVAVSGSVETAGLAESFNLLGSRLKSYQDNLSQRISEREATNNELRIARQIQESLLPRVFPPFPERKEIDLFAMNIPAKEVAGDFYDFFFLDPHRLALIIADVSDKGVASGLFMAVARTLLRNICPDQDNPATALEEVNRSLCIDNDRLTFVTLFLAYYDTRTGAISYANAGHHECLVLGREGRPRSFGKLGNTMLGFLPDYRYAKGEECLQEGETLVFYTDGITEATSAALELFGMERFEAVLREQAGEPLERICNTVAKKLDDFQQGRQFDDITLLLFKRNQGVGPP